MIMEKIWLSEKEASEYTGLHRHTLRKYRDHGSPEGIVLPASKIGRRFLYRRKDIDQFILDHRQ
jgi:excisionase family DNA binding protein